LSDSFDALSDCVDAIDCLALAARLLPTSLSATPQTASSSAMQRSIFATRRVIWYLDTDRNMLGIL